MRMSNMLPISTLNNLIYIKEPLMSRYRRISGGVIILLVIIMLTACGGSSTPQAHKPTPTPSPTPGKGVQILTATARKINTATTLHGVFNLIITGQTFNGTVNSEIWNAAPNKNRTVVLQSSVSQFPTGEVNVTDGKHIWQYDPVKKVV